MESKSGPDISSRAKSSSLSCWDDLTAALDAIRGLGDNYSNMRTYGGAPNPGLQIKDTLISLPLTESTAALIKNLSQRNSVGDEAQIPTATQASGVSEFRNDQVKFLNPAWPSFLDTILNDVCTKLQITVPVDINLWKLRLYEKGSISKPRDNSRKEESKIAELLIYLPSAHKGGQLRLYHAGQHHTFDTQKLSLFDTAAMAWHSDITHEMEEVVSGCRLVLVYDITLRTGSGDLANCFDRQSDALHNALLRCRRQDPDFSPRYYLLDNSYTSTIMSLNKLRMRDRAVCENLNKLRSQHGLYLLLGRCEKDERTNKRTKARPFTIYGLDGIRISHGRWLSRDGLLNHPCNEGGRMESSSFISSTRSQHNDGSYEAVIILCPKIHLLSYLERSEIISRSHVIIMVCNDLDEEPDGSGLSRDSLNILESIGTNKLSAGRGQSRIIEWAWRREYLGLYTKLVVSSMEQGEGAIGTVDTVTQIIREDILKETDTKDIRWEKYFSRDFRQIKNFDYFLFNLTLIKSRLRAQLRPSFQAWVRTIEHYAIENKETLEIQDERFLTRLITSNSKNSSWITKHFIPALKSRGENKLIRNLVELLLSDNGCRNPTNAREIAVQILMGTNWKTALDTTDLTGSPGSLGTGYMQFLKCCLKADLENLGIAVLDASWKRIASQHTRLSDLPLIHNKSIIPPFLLDLGLILRYNKVPYLHSMRELYKLLIRRYLHIVVPLPPKRRITQTDEEFGQAMDAYKQEFLSFEEPFQQLRIQYIEELLGEAEYGELVMLDRIKCPEVSKENAVAVHMGVKRLADSSNAGDKLPKKARTEL
ncbi:hypothetical protein F5Y09DRAFT_350864 [Xylaria sp. FL1042]|nr:hypothetical protein F5Y09DRAFT_350864 [Xylaria sp. FL1042]